MANLRKTGDFAAERSLGIVLHGDEQVLSREDEEDSSPEHPVSCGAVQAVPRRQLREERRDEQRERQATSSTFRQEVLDCGFALQAEPAIDGLAENYVMIFVPVPLTTPGLGWSSSAAARR